MKIVKNFSAEGKVMSGLDSERCCHLSVVSGNAWGFSRKLGDRLERRNEADGVVRPEPLLEGCRGSSAQGPLPGCGKDVRSIVDYVVI